MFKSRAKKDPPTNKVTAPKAADIIPEQHFIKLSKTQLEIDRLIMQSKSLEKTLHIMNETAAFDKKEISDVQGELDVCLHILAEQKNFMLIKQQFYHEVCSIHETKINQRTNAINEIQTQAGSSKFLPSFSDKMMQKHQTLIEKVEHIKCLILAGEESSPVPTNNIDIVNHDDCVHDPAHD